MRRHAPALALYGLTTVLALAPLWPAGLVFAQRDLLVYFLPMRLLVAESLGAGELPYRNPYITCGNPLLANPESQVLYPPAWGYTFLGLRGGTLVFYGLHLLLGAMGANMLARRLGVAPWAALIAGLAYGYSGVAFSLVEVQNVLCDRFAPWIVWAALGVRERPSPPRVALLSALEAVMVFGGEPSLFAATHGAVLAILLWPPSAARRLPLAAAATALTLLAAAGQVIPTTLYVLESDRLGGMSDADRGQWSLTWPELGELVVPGLLDAGDGGKHLGAQTYLPSVHTGFLGVLFVIAAAGRAWSRCERAIAGALALLLLMALGSSTPLFRLTTLLTAGSVRYPARYMALATLALALLAAFAVERLDRAMALGRMLGGGVALIALLQIARVAPELATAVDRGTLGAGLLLAGALLATGAIGDVGLRHAALGILVAGELLVAPRPFLETVPASTIERIEGCALPGGETLQGSDYRMLGLVEPGAALFRTRAAPPGLRACAAVQAGFGLAPALAGLRSAAVEPVIPIRAYESWLSSSPAMLPRASVRVLVLWRSSRGDAGLETRTIDARPRLSLARGSRPAGDGADPATLPLDEVVLEGPAPAGYGRGSLQILEERPSRIALRASLDGPGLLVATERWEPGWRALVDGGPSPVPIQRADGMLLALALPGGAHEVVLEHRPPWVRASLALSAVTWGLMTLLAVRALAGRGNVGS